MNNYNNYHKNQQTNIQKDYGPDVYATNITFKALHNYNFRTTLWTGHNLQMTLMNIPVNGEIGLEIHKDNDQFIRIESGCGILKTGPSKDNLTNETRVTVNSGMFIPAGTWHNIINTARCPLIISSIYAPPHHPAGTIHKTKAESDAAHY